MNISFLGILTLNVFSGDMMGLKEAGLETLLKVLPKRALKSAQGSVTGASALGGMAEHEGWEHRIIFFYRYNLFLQ